MGPLEQALRNAESPPEHKAAVQYFLRFFIIYESFYPMEAFLETPVGSTGQFYEEQGEEAGGGPPPPVCIHISYLFVPTTQIFTQPSLSLDHSLAQWSPVLCLQLQML